MFGGHHDAAAGACLGQAVDAVQAVGLHAVGEYFQLLGRHGPAAVDPVLHGADVALGDIRLLRRHHEGNRGAEEVRGALLLDGIEQQLGVKLRQYHMRGANVGATQQKDVERGRMGQRHHMQQPAVWAHVHFHRRGGSHRQQGVVVEQHALGFAGGARGVKQGAGLLAVHVGNQPAGVHLGYLRGWLIQAQAGGQCAGAICVFALGDDQARVAIAQDVFQLGTGQASVDRHHNGAEVDDGKVPQHPAVAVGHVQGNPVTSVDLVLLVQVCCQAQTLVVQFGPAEAAVRCDQGFARRKFTGVDREQLGNVHGVSILLFSLSDGSLCAGFSRRLAVHATGPAAGRRASSRRYARAPVAGLAAQRLRSCGVPGGCGLREW